ncbi:MAG: hypothetical protein ACJ8A6_10030 [Gemmatimonadales bacterium]
MITRSRQLACWAATWLLAGCASSGPDDASLLRDMEHGPALLAFYGDTSVVQLAATVRVGEVTPVRFTSFAGGCIRQAESVITVSGLTANIHSRRSELPSRAVCTTELRIDENVVELQFAEPGRARVRIAGLARPGDRPIVLERDLLVTP